MRKLKLNLILFAILLSSCSEDHGEASFSLKSYLKELEVNCELLAAPKFSKGYWVRSELEGQGILIVSKSNNPNEYVLSLMAHGHERALESREINCEQL